MSTLALSSLLPRLVNLTDEGDTIDLFAPNPPAKGLLSYPALAAALAPAEYAAWSTAHLDDVAAADGASAADPYDRGAHAARCRETADALSTAIGASPALGATLREAVLTRCRLTGRDPSAALSLLTSEGL
jgi:hypothetical protein